MPVARDVLDNAADRPERVALRSPARTCTYGELAGDMDAAAGALRARGAGSGSMVAIDVAEPVELLTTLLSADLVGAVPLVCDPSWSAEQRTTVLGSVAPDLNVNASVRNDDAGAGGTGPHEPGNDDAWRPGPDDLAWAGFSSGSTGRPRAIVRTRGSWTASYPAAAKLSGLTAEDTVLVPGPLASSLFCFAALHGLAAGAEVVVTGRWSPRAVREVLPEADIVHAVPHMFDEILTALEAQSRSGSQVRLRSAMVSGAALPPGLRERAASLDVDVVAYYGAVELSFVAVDPDGSGLRPFENVEIDVRPSDDGATHGEARLGEVWVRSPWIAAGYLAGATGPFRTDDAGWATVGDLADVTAYAGGTLRLRGRGDGAILTGGATVVPEDVEAVLAEVPGVTGVVVVGTPHERLGAVVTAVIETDGGTTTPRELLEATARRELAVAQRPRRWYMVDQLPRTSTGKPARAQVSEGLTTGALGARTYRQRGRHSSHIVGPFNGGGQ